MMVYVENKAEYLPVDETEPTDKVLESLRHRVPPPPDGRAGDSRVVLFPEGGRGTAPRASAKTPAGLHGVLHRPVRLRQVHHRQRADG